MSKTLEGSWGNRQLVYFRERGGDYLVDDGFPWIVVVLGAIIFLLMVFIN